MAVAVGVTAVALVVVAVAARKPAARYLLVGWLERQGVAADARVTGLSLSRFQGALAAGPAGRRDVEAPVIDVRYGFTGPWAGQPFGVSVIGVTAERPVVRAALRNGQLSLGTLDPLIQSFMRRPPQPNAAQPRIDIRQATLILATDYGPVTLVADGRLEDGKLIALKATNAPARLAGPAFSATLGAGVLTLRTAGGRSHAELALPVTAARAKAASFEAGVVTLALDGPYPDLVKKRGDGRVTASLKGKAGRITLGGQALTEAAFDAGFNGQASGWITDLAVRGAGAANLTARDLAGPARVSALALAATGEDLSWTRAGGDAVAGRLRLVGRADRLAMGDLVLTAASATAKGPVAAGPSGTRATLDGGLVARGAYRGLGPVGEDDMAALAALKRAAADFTLAAPAVRVSVNDRGPRLDLPQPIRVRSASGGAASLSAMGRGYRLAVAGGGLPRLEARANTVRFVGGGARVAGALDAAGDFGFVDGGRLRTTGELSLGEGGVRYVTTACADVAAERLEFGENSVAAVKGQFCPAGGPLFVMDGAGWRLAGRAKGVAGQVPSFQVAGQDAAANLVVRGRGATMSAEVAAISGRLVDRAPQTRFHPVQVEGAAALTSGVLTSALAGRIAGHAVGRADVRHDLAAGRGGMDVDTGELVFAEGGLQPAQLSPMAGAIGSPATGRARFVGRIDWRPGEASSRGELTTPGLDFVSPAGPAKGLSGTIAFTSLAPLATAPGQTVRIASVGGIAPLSDVEARFVIADETIRLGELHAGVGGGQVKLEEVEIPLAPDAQIRGTVELVGVQVHDMVEASPFGDKVELSARVSGRVPFELLNGRVRVREGAVRAIEPGRLSINRSALTGVSAEGAQALAQAGSPGLSAPVTDFAYQAMENLAFDQMDATLNSLPEGRLGILFHLRGRHDPPQKQSIRLSLADIIARRFMNKPLPLPSGTEVNLTLDTTVNLDDLLRDFGEYQKLRHSGDVQP